MTAYLDIFGVYDDHFYDGEKYNISETLALTLNRKDELLISAHDTKLLIKVMYKHVDLVNRTILIKCKVI